MVRADPGPVVLFSRRDGLPRISWRTISFQSPSPSVYIYLVLVAFAWHFRHELDNRLRRDALGILKILMVDLHTVLRPSSQSRY